MRMSYSVMLSPQALKALKKIDKYQARIIYKWLEKNLEGCENPRMHGKALAGNKKGYWRYRVGDYRLIADIEDDVVTIEIVSVGHRREVYQ